MCVPSIGSGGKSTPYVPPVSVIPAISSDDEKTATENAVNNTDKKIRRYAGQQATMLTNPLGLMSGASTQKKTLLGE